VAARVAAARARQVLRGVRSNAELEGERLETHATPDEAGRKLLFASRREAVPIPRAAVQECCGWRARSPIWRAPRQ
jgi:predicted ATPase with chaperone activity